MVKSVNPGPPEKEKVPTDPRSETEAPPQAPQTCDRQREGVGDDPMLRSPLSVLCRRCHHHAVMLMQGALIFKGAT